MTASRGTLFVVVGPSGAGKDTLLAGAADALSGDSAYVFARRVITRAEDAGGERHEAVAEAEFVRRQEAGGFLLSWRAHGLSYGLPIDLADALGAGRHVVANISRAVVADAARRHDPFRVVEVTAPPEILAARLAQRGRETASDIAARLAREAALIPDGLDRVTIVNDATREAGVDALLAALRAAPVATRE